jgi:hypothetical protein
MKMAQNDAIFLLFRFSMPKQDQFHTMKSMAFAGWRLLVLPSMVSFRQRSARGV